MNLGIERTTQIRSIEIEELTAESFAPFGTVIPPMVDTTPFGTGDAVPNLEQGTPRFYTMQLTGQGATEGAFTVTQITHHRNVTQTLASAGGYEWFMAVAPPVNLRDPADAPELDKIRAFAIPADTAITLHAGTWHAGPLFHAEQRSFFNLELSDTNVVDHHSCDLVATFGTQLQIG